MVRAGGPSEVTSDEIKAMGDTGVEWLHETYVAG